MHAFFPSSFCYSLLFCSVGLLNGWHKLATFHRSKKRRHPKHFPSAACLHLNCASKCRLRFLIIVPSASRTKQFPFKMNTNGSFTRCCVALGIMVATLLELIKKRGVKRKMNKATVRIPNGAAPYRNNNDVAQWCTCVVHQRALDQSHLHSSSFNYIFRWSRKVWFLLILL